VAVSGAAGAVGSLVGQIAKIKGCKVIGIAGSDEKGKWLVDELKFDKFLNYKDQDFDKKLAAAAPNGIDCYFDNVGGELSTKILNKMNLFGRISVCGAISGYNDASAARGDLYAANETFFSEIDYSQSGTTRARLQTVEDGRVHRAQVAGQVARRYPAEQAVGQGGQVEVQGDRH
jgi:NADPH:quinone reductase-like Zn-dependent oxidoreductase